MEGVWRFPSGIIGCSTPCTRDLLDMEREMGPAGILSIIGTAREGLWKLGNCLGWGICSTSSQPRCWFHGKQDGMGITVSFGDHSGVWGSQGL